MANFIHTETVVIEDSKGQPVAWASRYYATDFNTATPSLPTMGDGIKQAARKGASVLLLDGMSICVISTLGSVVVSPEMYASPTNSVAGWLGAQTSGSPTDYLSWPGYGLPLPLSGVIGKATIGVVRAAGYGATDDMALTMWGRFA
jgi:hypothetical protein